MHSTTCKLLFKLFLGTILLISCEREHQGFSFISSRENDIADAAFNHINAVVDTELEYLESQIESNKKNNFLSEEHDTFPNISWSYSTDFSHIDSVWIDYGEQGGQWKDRTKTGQILITQNGKRNEVGTVTKVELINFKIDDYFINGLERIERIETQINSGIWIGTDHVKIENAELIRVDGLNIFSWSSDRVRQANVIDGELLVCIEGNMNGVNSYGSKYTITTNSPLKFKLNCPRIVSGVLTLHDESYSNHQTIDYGEETCDVSADITIDNEKYRITLW